VSFTFQRVLEIDFDLAYFIVLFTVLHLGKASRSWWLTLKILATWKVEIRKITVQSQPYLENTQPKKTGRQSGSSGRESVRP
jgi:hypothetical protein